MLGSSLTLLPTHDGQAGRSGQSPHPRSEECPQPAPPPTAPHPGLCLLAPPAPGKDVPALWGRRAWPQYRAVSERQGQAGAKLQPGQDGLWPHPREGHAQPPRDRAQPHQGSRAVGAGLGPVQLQQAGRIWSVLTTGQGWETWEQALRLPR